MKNLFFIISFILILFFQKLHAQSTDILAIVGKNVITSKDFLERFELLPVKNKLDKESFLASLISEKLLYFEAIQNNIEIKNIYERKKVELERLFVKDELFKQMVLPNVKITNTEINEASKNYLFDYFVIVTQNGKILDTLVIHFGDVDEEIENVTYESDKNNSPQKINLTRYGEVFVQVFLKQQNNKATQKNNSERIAAVEKIIRDRKIIKVATEYFYTTLKNKKVVADKLIFKKLSDEIFSIIKSDSLSHQSNGIYFMSEKDYQKIGVALKSELQKSFIYFEQDSINLESFLDGAKYLEISFQNLEIETIQNSLNLIIKSFIESEILYREGKKMNLQYSKNVNHDVNMWLESDLAKKYSDILCNSTENQKLNCKELLNEHIIELTKKYSFQINYQKLKNINTTIHNMVTWRHLGFGGRILAVPSAATNSTWLKKWKELNRVIQ
ncbi:MAG: hypothetical protein O3A55_04595 [Bacteroidetes bacterium]|nr:hypothetical protein [Bacteroidota bacterium]